MGVRDITGRSALLQAEIAESDIKDTQPDRVPGQDVAGVVAGPLQVLAKPKNESAGASRPGNTTQTGTQFASVRQKRDTTSSSAPGAGQAGGVGSASSTTAASGTGKTAATTSATADPIGAQREEFQEFQEFYSLSGQAEAVFDQKPPPSLRRGAQDAFEKAFPNVTRPVDLDKLYVNTYRKEENSPGSSQFVYTLVSSRSVADLIVERYSGGQAITLDDDAGTVHGIYRSADALYNDNVDLDDENTVGGITLQKLEQFINGLPADKAKDVKLQDAGYFRKPSKDGKTPLQTLGEIRGKQIQAEAQLRYDDKTLRPESKALVESVVKNPTQADLDRAFPNARSRPRVFSLSITLDGEPVADKTLYGPLVMMTPKADAEYPGESDCVVLYLPGQGLKQFKSVEEMKKDVKFSPSLLPEQDQADSLSNEGYDLGGFKDVPHGKNFFEHSVEQQVDKQGRDTEYRMAQAHERGVDLTELDQIAGASSDDLRESFDADGPLKERDLRLIEENRPEWWKKGSSQDRAALGTYQEAADQLENNFEELESGIPTLEEFAVGKIREELQAKYPGIDPDKSAVTIGYYQPPEGPTRLNPNPQPQYKTISVTLTEYVVLERRLAQNPPDDDTGFSGTLLDILVSGSDFAKLFRENKVSVTATLSDTDGNAITDTSGKAVTLDKNALNALAGKLDIGKGYKELLTDKYLGANGQKLQSTWKAAYLARMQVDAQEARMSGEIDALYDDKTPSRMVQAVLKSPDSQKREKVNRHEIQTEEFTVDIWEKGQPQNTVRATYPVNGMLVIGAADKGLATVVLYTPDGPDGKTFRTYRSREDMKKDPMFKQPEWIAYFKGRVSLGNVSVGGKTMTRQAGIEQYTEANEKSGSSWTSLNTNALKGDFTAPLYSAAVSTKLENADTFSVTNDELHQESLQKKISAGIGLAFDLVDVVPFGKLAKGLRALGRLANPRKILARLPKGIHLLRETGHANKVPFGVARHNTGVGGAGPSLELLKEIEIPSNRLKDLKYIKADDMYADGPYRYILIGKRLFRLDRQQDVLTHEARFFIRKEFDSLTRYPVERVGDQWVVKKEPRTGGAGSDTSLTSTATINQQPILRLRHPDRVRLNNIVQNLAAAPFDEQAFRRNAAELIDVLSADGNQDTFRRLIDVQTAQGNLTLIDRAAILSEVDPYQRSRRYFNIFEQRNVGADRAKLPQQLKSAIANGDDVATASKTVESLLAADQRSLAELAQNSSISWLDDSAFVHGSELHRLLQSPANQDTFRRLIDVQTAQGNLTLIDRAAILSEVDPYLRVHTYVRIFKQRNVGADRAKLPQQLKSAIANGDDVATASKTVESLLAADQRSLAELAQNSSISWLDNSTFEHGSELHRLLQSPANQDTLWRLIDIQLYDGRISLADIHAITRYADPYQRVHTYLRIFKERNVGPNRAKMAQDLQLATSRVTDSLTSKRSLTQLADNLAAAPFDEQAFRRNAAELIDVLSADGNQDTFRRLIDVQTAQGNLTLIDRAAILSEVDPYQRSRRYFNIFEQRNVGADRAKLPQQLKSAIANGDDVATASKTVESLLAADQRSLAELAQNSSISWLDDSAFVHGSELHRLLQSPANQDTLWRLIDIQLYDGRISLADIHAITRYADPYQRVHTYLRIFKERNVGPNRAKMAQDLQLATSRVSPRHAG